ncbi:MAG: replication-relaxation family protein [Eubacterium sp.]|nr:replication-relaxation family protein [Eubacterium sp.]
MTDRPTDRIGETTPESRRFPANMSFKGKDDYRITAESLPIPEEEPPGRLGKRQLLEFIDRLGERDFEILISLRHAKYLMTGQIQRLHIPDASTPAAAMRAAAKNMNKLKGYGLVRTFNRRIGGIRAGSASYVWHLTEAGYRLLDLKERAYTTDRSRRHLEPSFIHMKHTIAIAECYVQLVEISRKAKNLVLNTVEWEPDCWRPYRDNGHDLQMKPDLFVVTYNGGYEDRWFIEMDLNTEALPVVIDKCARYHQYFRTGIEQRQNEVFPITVWIVPDENRKQKIIDGLAERFINAPKLFVVITPDEFEHLIRHGAAKKQMH